MKKFLQVIILVFCFMTGMVKDVMALAVNDSLIENVEILKADNNGESDFNMDEDLIVRYTMSSSKIQKGEQIILTIPEEIKIFDKSQFDLNTPDGTSVGIVYVQSSQEVRIDFNDPNDYLANHKNFKIILNLNCKFNSDNLVEGKNTISFDLIPGTKDIELNITGSYLWKGEVLFGWGDLIASKGYIEWAVRINVAKEDLGKTIITQELGAGMDWIKESIEIYKIDFKDNGDCDWDTAKEITEKCDISIDDNNLTINLGSVKNKSYIIFFDTSINDVNKKIYEDNVTLKGSNNISDSYTMEVLTGDGVIIGEYDPSKNPSNPEEKPTEPSKPGEGENPSNPEEKPTEPSKPGEGENPSNPEEKPTEPSKPGEGENPSNPEEKPTEPSKPGEGENPSNPEEKPTEPSKPGDEENPSNPEEKPTEPSKPGEGENPSNPEEKPTEPSKPGEGENPSNPEEKPIEPNEPEEEEKPSKPEEKPEEGENPLNPEEKPTELNNQEDKGKSNTNEIIKVKTDNKGKITNTGDRWSSKIYMVIGAMAMGVMIGLTNRRKKIRIKNKLL